jgi:transposase-like protein
MPTVTKEKPAAVPARRKGRYPKQFRRDVAALVIDQHRTVADVARELGVIEQRIGNWVRQERIDRGEREGTTTEMREENVRLRREVKRLTMERDLAQTKCGLLGEGAGPVIRYRHVSAMKAEGFPVEAACEAAEVSTSAFYDWLARSAGPTDAEWDEALLINEIRRVHDELDDTYGSPRMTDVLRDRGFCANHKRVERVMAENDIYAQDGRRKKVRTTIPDVSAPPLPDLVGRDFRVSEPGLRTCGDITYIPTGEGWLYLAGVLDLGSRRCVGYTMEGHMRSELVEAALEMAVETRGR